MKCPGCRIDRDDYEGGGIIDAGTGFWFCHDCWHDIRDAYHEYFPADGIGTWLRAIADVSDMNTMRPEPDVSADSLLKIFEVTL